MRRSDILVASTDILSADMVGAKLLGYEPSQVPHLAMAAANHRRPADLSDVVVVGERIETLAGRHVDDVPYASDEDGEMPMALAKQGIQGLFTANRTTPCAPIAASANMQFGQGH